MEGPSLVILREQTEKFIGKKVTRCDTSLAAIDCKQIQGRRLTGIVSWGKHFILSFGALHLRVHFLMFGSCWVDEKRAAGTPRLSLHFAQGELHFYACSIQVLPEPPEKIYDWRIDLMSDKWNERHVLRLVEQQPPTTLLCDLLLDQTLFAGSGNIIKNEVLFLAGLQPETKLRVLTAQERKSLVRAMRDYCFQFYEWKKTFFLKKNWKIYRQRACKVCQTPAVMKVTGALKRVSFYCPQCQRLRSRKPAAR